MTGDPESAGINRHIVGDARALQERSSDPILASSLAQVVVSRQAKRRQTYRWAGYGEETVSGTVSLSDGEEL